MILKQNIITKKQNIQEQKEIKNNILETNLIKIEDKQHIAPKIRDIKHYAPANKEWSNSVYAYNKNFTRTLPAKDNIAKKLVKSYFYLTNYKGLARSRRMRSLIRKRSNHLFHVSNPEIKQTNDKVTLTVHIFNREKQNLTRKIMFFNRRRLMLDAWRKDNNLYLNNIRSLLNKKLTTRRISANLTYASKFINYKKKRLNPKYKSFRFFFKRGLKRWLYKINKRKMSKPKYKPAIPNYGIKFKSEMNLFSLKKLTKKNFFSNLRKKFYLNFLKYVLSIFKVKVIIPLKELKRFRSTNTNIYFLINNTLYSLNPYLVDREIENYDNKSNILKKLNFFISLFLDNILTRSNIQNKEKKLNLLFKAFFKKYYLNFISKAERKKVVLSNHFLKLMINNFKLSKFLPGLKLSISRIYNKKAELNIIDLKYLHLNTDIYTKSIARKLAKKVSQNKVLKKCLDMVKIPERYSAKLPIYDIKKIGELYKYESSKLDPIKDKKTLNPEDYLQYVLKKIYPRTLITNDKPFVNRIITLDNKNISSKLISVLNSIRYKWIAGIRLETAGRLTRRFTAARAVNKFIYKGSLKNKDYSRKLTYPEKKKEPVVSLRNHVKSNTQYTMIKSKKRIGAFGVRGWISGY